jgi:hypothetical protein
MTSENSAIGNRQSPIQPADLAAFRAQLPARLRVLIITPCDDGHKLCFWQSLRAFEKTPDPAGHTYEILTPPGDSLITRARNNYNHTFFFGTDFDYLLWIDSDLDFRPEDIHRLVAHRLPIVGGTYYIKARDTRPCINSLPGEGTDPETGLMRVASTGTGALMYHRSVVAAMIAAADSWDKWRLRYIDDANQDTRYALFFDGVIDDKDFPHTPRFMSEDWSWCYFARKLGYDIWLDTRAVFLHRGEIDYPLHARRMSAEEVQRGELQQPDGAFTPIAKPEPV